MDGHTFDKLTRTFAGGVDRRTLLKLFGGATIAGVAAVAIPRTAPVLAQGTLMPGDTCQSGEDCMYGQCTADNGGEPICNCASPDRPWIGCPCLSQTDGECGGGTPHCCTTYEDDPPGTSGVCVSGMADCRYSVDECSELQTSCAESGCCVDDTECGANDWCNACVTGTDNACAGVNEAFGTDYICCMYGDDVGALGLCVAESDCIVQPPNTGAGTTSSDRNWITPAAAIGATAAVLAFKSRDSQTEPDA